MRYRICIDTRLNGDKRITVEYENKSFTPLDVLFGRGPSKSVWRTIAKGPSEEMVLHPRDHSLLEFATVENAKKFIDARVAMAQAWEQERIVSTRYEEYP